MPTLSPILLASGSSYRRKLLERLGLPFEAAAPDIDEQPSGSETARNLVSRLALAKVEALATRHHGTVIIGSDQVAALHTGSGEQILGKPGTHAGAVEQLLTVSGREVQFLTALCVRYRNWQRRTTVTTGVFFRSLTTRTIENYLLQEPAYDCAGSFKAEGLGITLCAAIHSDDPTALIGLPLIALSGMLGKLGYSVAAARP